jgi:hypothetical protein
LLSETSLQAASILGDASRERLATDLDLVQTGRRGELGGEACTYVYVTV